MSRVLYVCECIIKQAIFGVNGCLMDNDDDCCENCVCMCVFQWMDNELCVIFGCQFVSIFPCISLVSWRINSCLIIILSRISFKNIYFKITTHFTCIINCMFVFVITTHIIIVWKKTFLQQQNLHKHTHIMIRTNAPYANNLILHTSTHKR